MFIFVAGVITFAGPKADIAKKIQSAEENTPEIKQEKGIAISNQNVEAGFQATGWKQLQFGRIQAGRVALTRPFLWLKYLDWMPVVIGLPTACFPIYASQQFRFGK